MEHSKYNEGRRANKDDGGVRRELFRQIKEQELEELESAEGFEEE